MSHKSLPLAYIWLMISAYHKANTMLAWHTLLEKIPQNHPAVGVNMHLKPAEPQSPCVACFYYSSGFSMHTFCLCAAVCPKAKGCGSSVCYVLLFIQMEASSNLQHDNAEVGETFEVKLNDHMAFKLETNESNNFSDQTTGKSERKNGSLAWKYFIPRTTCAICKLCRKLLKRSGGSTSNLLQHLQRDHWEEYAMLKEYSRQKMEAATREMVC